MAGPDVGKRPPKGKIIKKGTPSRRPGGMSGASKKMLKTAAWVQTGGAHRKVWKGAEKGAKAAITNPKKAASAVGEGVLKGSMKLDKAVTAGTKKAKSGWSKFKRGVKKVTGGSATSQQWKTRNKKK
jgi:hypothetical protein